MACNVFWKVEGLVSMASGTFMRGTVIANNAAINMNTGDTLEGRALSTAGAVTVDGVLAYTPIGCGSPVLNGPVAPDLGTAACYAVFSSDGAVSNAGITHITGDVGTNVGLTTGFDTLLVTGKVHLIPDGSTAACAADLLVAYNYVNTLPNDIELLYPAQFGNNLVLTPHTYIMNGAVTFTDSLYLNALGNANAVFVIKIKGAIETSTYSKVLLINGTQAKNVYWMVDGAVSINNYSVFNGTIICNNGALGALNTGVTLNGRALTTTGALTTAAITATIPSSCVTNTKPNITAEPANQTANNGSSVSFTVSATGTGLTYQWRKGTDNLIDGGNISGATTATLTINPVDISDTASNYNVVITGTGAQNVTSVNVPLIVNPLPAAVAGADRAINLNTGTQIGAATVTGSTYSWSSVPAGFTSTIANPTVTPLVTTTYTVVETITATGSTNSHSVVVTVNPLPAAVAGADRAINLNTGTQIGATAVTGSTYSWSSVPAGFTSTLANPTVTPLVTTTYTVVENHYSYRKYQQP